MQVDEIEVCTGPLHILSALVAYHMLLKTKENSVTKHACIQGYLLDFLSTSSWIEKAIAAAVHIWANMSKEAHSVVPRNIAREQELDKYSFPTARVILFTFSL